MGTQLHSPQRKGLSPQFSAHVYCGQTAVCIRILLGTEVSLSLGDIVLDGDPAPPPLKGQSSPHDLRPMSVVAKRLDGLRCHLATSYGVGLGPGDVVLDGVAAPPKRGRVRSFWPMSIVAKRLDG